MECSSALLNNNINKPANIFKNNQDYVKTGKKDLNHASSYFFPVDGTTPLRQHNENKDQNPNSASGPQSGQYYYEDYSLSMYLGKYALNPGDNIQIYFRYLEGFNEMVNHEIQIKIYKGFYRDYNSWYPNYYEDVELVLSTSILTDFEGNAYKSISSIVDTGVYTIQAIQMRGYIITSNLL